MTASIKIRQLESKISHLQNQHQNLLKERQQEIAALLSAIDLAHLDDKTLLGGLLFLKEKITNQDSTGRVLVEAWHAAGEKFLRRAKPRTYPREIGKHASVRPQIPSEKHASSKQTTAPQATDQSPKKQPCQGDE